MRIKGLLKKIVIAALAAVMSLGCFVGCSPSGGGKLQIWAGSYWGGDNEPIMQEMVDKWNEYARANGKTEAEFSVKQDMKGNMTTGAISGMIGDVIIWDRWESLRLANQETFMPVDDKLTASGHSIEEFNAAAMNETKYNGKYYGIPFDLDTWGLFVNRKMYVNWAKTVTDADTLAWLVNEGKTDETTVGQADSKFNYPDDWNEFYTAARGCTKRNSSGQFEVAGLTVDAEFVAWLTTAGGAVADVEKGEVLLHKDTQIPGAPEGRTYRKATEDVLAWLDKLIEQDTDTDEEKEQAVTSFTFFTNTGTLDYFLTQKVAFKTNSILNGMTTYNKYKTEDFAFDFIPFPSAPGLNKRGGMLGGYSMSIPERAPKKDEAWELIEWWILNDDNYKTWSEMSNLIPTRTSVMNKVRQDEQHLKNAPYLRDAIDCIGNYATRPPHIAYSTYETSIQSPSLDVYLRRTTKGVNTEASNAEQLEYHVDEFFRKIEGSSNLNNLLGTGQ